MSTEAVDAWFAAYDPGGRARLVRLPIGVRAGWLSLLVACSGPTVDPPPEVTEPEPEPTDVVELLRLDAEPVPDLVTAQLLEVELSAPGAIEVRCVRSGDPDEEHLLSRAQAVVHEVLIGGLLADETYMCTVLSDGAELGSLEVRTPEPPWPFPQLQPQGHTEDFLLFDHFQRDTVEETHAAYMVDPDGGIRWYIGLQGAGVGVELAPVAEGLFLAGKDMTPRLVGLDGAELWKGLEPPTGTEYHHDGVLLPSGAVLTLRTEPNSAGGVGWEGFAVELTEPDASAPHWSWSSQQAVDSGVLAPGSRGSDPYHANAVAWVEDAAGPAVYVSLYRADAILRVDVELGEVTWSLGVDRDFTLRDPGGALLGPEDWFFGQHGLDVDGTLLYLYDNGRARPDGSHRSRAVTIELDTEAWSATLAWAWEEEDWFSVKWGDIDLLPSGNVLISQVHDGTGPEDRTAYVEVDPRTDEVVHRLEASHGISAGYRAERLDPCVYVQFHHLNQCG